MDKSISLNESVISVSVGTTAHLNHVFSHTAFTAHPFLSADKLFMGGSDTLPLETVSARRLRDLMHSFSPGNCHFCSACLSVVHSQNVLLQTLEKRLNLESVVRCIYIF